MTSKPTEFVIVDGKEIPIEGERNLLEVIRKGNIDIPTFCYHSELSIYGACRLCLVDIEGRGLQTSCSTKPENGMKVKTNTKEIREIRKDIIELLLANHELSCTTCSKSGSCQLQDLARRFGITEVSYERTNKEEPLDYSSPSLIRDPNKCVLCGDCVRYCAEIQDVGALDFAFRGSDVMVLPAFGKDIDKVECINCGQCARVCPTGAIIPKPEINEVWEDIYNEEKITVAQIAPAIRVAVGEYFGLEPGTISTGKIVAALKAIGFDYVFDTSFAADLTILEEGSEFLSRKLKGEKLPQFTSCCPAWVKFAEQYYPEFLPNLSSCRSPQQMFGSVAKEILPNQFKAEKSQLSVTSIMPCTAKKFESRRPEFITDGVPDVDHVLTTQELCRMIEEVGINFKKLKPESLDMPLGFKTGAGVIFGNSGGVTEAALRYVAEKMTGETLEQFEFKAVRGEEGIRTAEIIINNVPVKLAVVHGLANARKIAEEIKSGKADYDFIEVMACPGGCVGGAGQPVMKDFETIRDRTKSLYDVDKTLQLHKSQDNPYIIKCYEKYLGEIGGKIAHRLLHTGYSSRKRITDEGISLVSGKGENKVEIKVCVGTNCFLRGSQDLLQQLIKEVENRDMINLVDVKASFCFEKCDRGPVVAIGDTVLEKCSFQNAKQVLEEEIQKISIPVK